MGVDKPRVTDLPRFVNHYLGSKGHAIAYYRPMRNLLGQHRARLALVLLLGIAITIAISWTAMFWPRNRHGCGPLVDAEIGLTQSTTGDETWQISEGRNAWHHVVSYWRMQISGLSLMMPLDDYKSREVDLKILPSHLRPKSVDDLTMQAWYREVGWPMPALTCSIQWVRQISNADIIYEVNGGIQLPRDAEFQPRALPFTPLWPGFAVDVLLWSAAGMVLAGCISGLRRSIRRRRGCCVNCGYSRTGRREGSVCPECGM